MKKTVKKLKYCLIISLIIISQFFGNISCAASVSNLGNDLKKLNNNYSVVHAAENLSDSEFDEWTNAMIDILNIGLPSNKQVVDQYGTIGYNYGKSSVLDRNSKISYYSKASDVMSSLRSNIYEIANLDDYLETTTDVKFLKWTIGQKKVNQEETERLVKFRKKILNNLGVNGLGDTQKYIESAKLTYKASSAAIDMTFGKTASGMKNFDENEIDSYLKTFGYNYPTNNRNDISEVETAWAKTLGIDRSNIREYAVNVISGSADKKQFATADEVNANDKATQKKLEELIDNTDYKHPDTATKKNSSDNKDDMDIDKTIKNADEFVSQKGEDGNPENNINTEDLKDFFNPLYNITLIIGIIVAVLVGAILGIKFLTGSVEQKADTKKLLIPYLAGCVAVFGAFGIWKLVVTILADL